MSKGSVIAERDGIEFGVKLMAYIEEMDCDGPVKMERCWVVVLSLGAGEFLGARRHPSRTAAVESIQEAMAALDRGEEYLI